MTTFKRILTTGFFAMLAAGLVLAAVPAAAEVVAAAGTIRAQGSGQIWAYGQGQMSFQLAGDGRLTIRHADANQILSNGSGTKIVNGTSMSFYGYKGTITVTGTSIAVYYTGTQANFQSYGNAKVIMAGAGTYKVEDQDAAAWEDYGTTVVMGAPSVSDEDQVWGDTAEYAAQTEAAVREIVAYPQYQAWATVYPEAAVQLVYCHDYYYWCSTYPTAVAALYASPGWVVYIGYRLHLYSFIGYHNEYIVWYHEHPTFRPYFCHPVVYYGFVQRHHDVFVSITVGVTYNDWRGREPERARRLEERATVVRGKDTYIKQVQPRAERDGDDNPVLLASAQRQLSQKDAGRDQFKTDLNGDGVVDKSEKKAADDAQKIWKNETDQADRKAPVSADAVRGMLDTNKDGKVSQAEIDNSKDAAKASQQVQKDEKQAAKVQDRQQDQMARQQEQAQRDQAKQAADLQKQNARAQDQLNKQQDQLDKQQNKAAQQLDRQQGQLDKNSAKPLVEPPYVVPADRNQAVKQENVKQGNRYQLDLNNDGQVDKSEQKAAGDVKRVWKQESKAQGDANLPVDAERVRQAMDQNGDGNVTPQEIKDAGRAAKGQDVRTRGNDSVQPGATDGSGGQAGYQDSTPAPSDKGGKRGK